MENSQKNAPVINDLDRQVTAIRTVREHLGVTYNNDMNKDVVKVLRHAEHIIEDYKETLQ